MNNEESVELHYNPPQLLFQLVQAAINVCLWGRATGKTEGPMATFTVNNIHAMPRSNGFLVGTTYEQLLTRTLPPLIAGWEKLGYYENLHYWIRSSPPANFKIPKAYRYPLKTDHYVQWYNGSGIYLVSQDRPGTINGVRTQWGAGDEAKFLNHEKLKNEVLLTMAGQAQHFAHLSNYLSLLFCSDMPTNSKGKWLLDYKGQMDEETITAILQVCIEIMRLRDLIDTSSKTTVKHLQSRINQLESYLNELRKDTVYCSFASTLDNIHALGLEPIKLFKRTLNDLMFQISVLNKKILSVENGFYGLLDEDSHGYDAYDYNHIDSLTLNYRGGISKDSRWDADILHNEPLDISPDYNSAINSMVVGQENGRSYRFVHSMYVLHPLLLKDLVKKFTEYFKHHRNKRVNYYYDHTAIGGNASSDISYADQWTSELESAGWEVNRCYIGQASAHHSRYALWGMMLKGDNPKLPIFSYNKTNAASWYVSAIQAKVKQKNEYFGKDKSSELDENVPAFEATHLTECGDTLIYGKVRHRVGDTSQFFDTLIA